MILSIIMLCRIWWRFFLLVTMVSCLVLQCTSPTNYARHMCWCYVTINNKWENETSKSLLENFYLSRLFWVTQFLILASRLADLWQNQHGNPFYKINISCNIVQFLQVMFKLPLCGHFCHEDNLTDLNFISIIFDGDFAKHVDYF